MVNTEMEICLMSLEKCKCFYQMK